MAGAKVAFIHGLTDEIVEVITGHTPDGRTTVVIGRDTPPEEQQALAHDADFLMVYAAPLADDVLRAADKARLVQLLAAATG